MGLPDGYSCSFYIFQNCGGREVRRFIGCNGALLFKTRSVAWHNGEAPQCVCRQPFCSSERKYRVAKAGVSLLAASLSLSFYKRGGRL